MVWSICVRVLPQLFDYPGSQVSKKVSEFLACDVAETRITQVFILEGLEEGDVKRLIAENILHDPVLQEASLEPFSTKADYILEASLKAGVTDNLARTSFETIKLFLSRSSFSVRTAIQYHFVTSENRANMEKVARELLTNELIQSFSLKSQKEWQASPGFNYQEVKKLAEQPIEVNYFDLNAMSDDELMRFSRENTLALSLEELHTIQSYYASEDVKKAREKAGFLAKATDAEIEALAQTWSEHCKHKIFAAAIEYTDKERGKVEKINSLYKSCIQKTTAFLRKRLGEQDYCRSVFKDNAGVVAFDEEHDVCIKVETHNSPSALDPYGGALTGIVGVNRDPMGTGMGASLVCNMDVFCFASPFHEGELPPRLLHPRRIMEGVREGVEDGGNKSGVPTVNGSIVFDERYLGKPLVYCGTVGMMPRVLHGKAGHEKKAQVGDRIVMVGGRIGKDGIHGATFSSEELHDESPVTAVQIGDPITQRKVYDFILRARDLGLYNAITDNGAGGLSSSVGEMAEDTGGCLLDLSKAPLKYPNLQPWEILLSEAQERMTLAVPPSKIGAFLDLAQEMDVLASDLGEFTDSGFFHVCYGEHKVAYLAMDFLHDGVPQMQLKAVWERPKGLYETASLHLEGTSEELRIDSVLSQQSIRHENFLERLLSRLNICSKEYLIRQYDHEVKGGSVIKPLMGVLCDGPTDAAVLRPDLKSEKGLVLSHGICPKWSDVDCYWMAANAIDEAVRNAVAVGANPERLSGVDNFCWCDPIVSETNPDGEYKLAQLVRANKALQDFCLAFGVPCISGKDSMKNDYIGGGKKISIPPTLLFTVLGEINNVNFAVSSDFKKEGDLIYVLGQTYNELACSEAASELGLQGGLAPQVDVVKARLRYSLFYKASQKKLVSACHDISDGGLAVALAEMCIGGRLGARVCLDQVPAPLHLSPAEILYSESASRLLVCVSPENQNAFEELFKEKLNKDVALIGTVTKDSAFAASYKGEELFSAQVEALAEAFKKTLRW